MWARRARSWRSRSWWSKGRPIRAAVAVASWRASAGVGSEGGGGVVEAEDPVLDSGDQAGGVGVGQVGSLEGEGPDGEVLDAQLPEGGQVGDGGDVGVDAEPADFADGWVARPELVTMASVGWWRSRRPQERGSEGDAGVDSAGVPVGRRRSWRSGRLGCRPAGAGRLR